ncbi:MAG: hypothetical protein IPM74_06005 [Crocinitomicaceae bacterium]|nr:hypothetical protein [Crocinitomicaceae bacterium]
MKRYFLMLSVTIVLFIIGFINVPVQYLINGAQFRLSATEVGTYFINTKYNSGDWFIDVSLIDPDENYLLLRVQDIRNKSQMEWLLIDMRSHENFPADRVSPINFKQISKGELVQKYSEQTFAERVGLINYLIIVVSILAPLILIPVFRSSRRGTNSSTIPN